MSAKTLRLKPAAPGLIVRDPESGRVLPAAGAEVPNTQFWRRRMADGSAVGVPEKKPAAAKPEGSKPVSPKPGGSGAAKPKS